MDAFNPIPPAWIENAVHALSFHCPHCGAAVTQSQKVWLNRRAPVLGTNNRRKFQEFYECGECGGAWWAWSSDRPPSDLVPENPTTDPNPD